MTSKHNVFSAETVSSKKRWPLKKTLFVSAIGAAVVVPTAAWAAVTLFGFGNFDSAAAAPANLTVDNISLTKSLVPGGTSGTKGIVHNPNDFPVTVTGVIVKNSSIGTTGASCNPATVHLLGTPGATYPAEDGGGAGTAQAIAANVTIPAGGAGWVTVPESVKQDEAATGLCGVKGRFAVKAQNAS